MEPGLPPEQLPARVAELREQADQAMAALRERVAAAQQLRAQAAGTTGEASSGDGRVRAVVDMTGVVTSLTFAPSVFDHSTPASLASTVVATIQAAAAKARATVNEAMAPLKTDRSPSSVAGLAELRDGSLDVPSVPRTAADPTVPQEPGGARQPADQSSERPW
jgi:DNA-binding protein YbaB